MILCAGECLIDMLPREIEEQAMLEPVAGGAVMNTAVALGRLGVPVEFLSGLSSDQFGRVIETHLNNSQVGLSHVVRSDRPTTLAFVDFSDGVVSYDFYDEGTAGRMIKPNDLPALPEATQAVFCGGISLINAPAADAYAALVERNEDRLVMLDPNIRPSFIKDEPAFRARLAGMLSHADVVKTSDEDLEWLFPNAETAEAGIEQMLALGPKIVLFTEGSKGASVYRAGKKPVFVPSEKVKVVDTVGAGDTFNGGFLASLFDQDLLSKTKLASVTDHELATALGFAGKCAAHSVQQVGAQPPWGQDVMA